MATADVSIPQMPAPHVPMNPARRRALEIPAKPMMGLPLKRTIPIKVHGVLDYANAATMAASALMAKTPEGRMVGLSVAGAVSGVSMVTDYDLSVAKIVPIEVHELADYASAAMSIAAPFVLGYHRRDPLVAALHVFAGITTLLGSLMTDYRANRGVTWRGWPDRTDGRLEGARAER